MIDRELIERKLVLILRDLVALDPIVEQGVDHFLGDLRDQAVVERYLERMVGRMIDINYHLLTATGEPPPSDYYGSFVRLAASGILEASFAREIASAAGLRNHLVHEYDDIDPQKVFDAARRALVDVPRYGEAIRRALPASPTDQ